MEQTQLTIEQLEASKTGNKTKDRINFIQAWEKIYFSDTNEDSELFHYIVNELDELLPKNIAQFTQDMRENSVGWVTYLMERAKQVDEGYDPDRAYKLIHLAIKQLRREVNEQVDETTKVAFTATNDYDEKLIREVLNISTEFEIFQVPLSEAYFILSSVALAREDETAAINALAQANQWNPVFMPALLYIGQYFKSRNIVERLRMISSFAANIAIQPESIGGALRLVGYSYYLDGKYEKAYACYHESLRYGDNPPPTTNDEINAILIALNLEEPPTLSSREVRDLFLGERFFPGPSEVAFRTLKNVITDLFEEQKYLLVIEYAQVYLESKLDLTVEKLLRLAKEHLS
ncbi:MAG: hypothetical protein GX350_04245 [Erysipelotrichaceae bacterium]|nr:hypothetical protein [Erysipelotrichaceae bacterium]